MEFPEEAETAWEPSLPAVGSAEEIRVRRKTLEAVLEQCHRALELLQKPEVDDDIVEEEVEEEGSNRSDFPSTVDYEAKELCNLLKSRVESPEFLEKLGSIHMPISPEVSDDSTSWDMVTLKDVWDDKKILVDNESEEDSYVLVRQEDIVDGIACFMAAYLLSLKDSKDTPLLIHGLESLIWRDLATTLWLCTFHTTLRRRVLGCSEELMQHNIKILVTELTPNQLQEALCKTFSGKKKKSRLQKAWDGSKVVYNVASWSATAIGIYQNPALLRAASLAFSISCRAISKLL